MTEQEQTKKQTDAQEAAAEEEKTPETAAEPEVAEEQQTSTSVTCVSWPTSTTTSGARRARRKTLSNMPRPIW